MKDFKHARIAICAGRDPSIRDDTDGGSVFLEYLLAELETLGAEVDLFMPLGLAGARYDHARADAQRSTLAEHQKGSARRVYVPVPAQEGLGIETDEHYFTARIERSRAFAEGLREHSFAGYDAVFLLHVANAFFLVADGLVPLDRTVLFPMMTSSNYAEFSRVPAAYTELERTTIARMRHICTPSEDELERLVREFGAAREAVFKVHRGFEPADFPIQQHRAPEPHEPLVLLCANGIRPQKDHMFLLEVLDLLRKERDVHLHLTGNNGRSHNPVYNKYAELFWRTVKEKGLADSITAHDIVSREELVGLMSLSHMAVYPSKSETFGKSALESAVSGLPTIVCEDVPAFSEFIDDERTGVIAPRTASAYAGEILDLVGNARRYQAIADRGIALRPEFSWSHVMHRLSDELARRFA